MGKNLTQQKRGKGSLTYKAPSFRYKGKVKYPSSKKQLFQGKILDLLHCQGHSAPLAKIGYENKEQGLVLASEGVKVGDLIYFGESIPIKNGSVIPLKDIPTGIPIFNIEGSPGDGGKFVRSSGTHAKIVTKLENQVIIELPSTKRKTFLGNCRATIGVIAGSGRCDKPFLNAGRKYYAKKSKNKKWPSVSGTSMNAVDHPFGGSSSSIKGRPTQSSRNAPPGRKVGKIAPSRTGRKKR